jgi:hypothetical protein
MEAEISSRYWRTLTSNFAVGVALEYALCLAISLVVFETDQGVIALSGVRRDQFG